MKRVRFTISMLSEDQDIVKHHNAIKADRAISSYIRNLIRQDMHGKPSNDDLDQLADKIASKLNKKTLSKLLQEEKTKNKVSVSLENKSIINGLF